MIKEAIDRVLGLAPEAVPIQTIEINGGTYTTARLTKITKPLIKAIEVHNLSAIVDYLKSDFDGISPVVIHVYSPTKVSVLTGLNEDKHRSTLIDATALLPSIRFNNYDDLESFNIMLQSCFVPADPLSDKPNDREAVLRLVGNVRDEQVLQFGDDGVSQQVTAKTGVATVEPVPVPNPVTLKPFRTFVEIEQPASAFVLRMQKGPAAALFEADGGAWKVVAIDSIKTYFHQQLEGLVEAGKVVIVG